MADRHIVAMGGGGPDDVVRRLDDFVLALARSEAPRVCFLPTAVGDDAWATVRFYSRFAGRALEATHVDVFPWPRADLRDHLLAQDVVVVSGGNTANMLAIWRVHRIDAILRDAWENGVVLSGWSAGMICWFEAGVTDSFGPQLESMECLGWLAGSACPHYDGEELRRPRYHELIASGLPGGIAAEDGVALYYRGAELAEIVTARERSRAYRVELLDGEVRETPLDPRLL